jgi:2-dehydro-3-deoxyphosphooctonate aldolase (KDO 8-P synthase)
MGAGPSCRVRDDVVLGEGRPLVLVCGPDVIETEERTLETARTVKRVAEKYGLPAVFKCSFDKANRTSLSSYRGPGLEAALPIFARVKAETGLPLLTDVHETCQVERAAEVADVLQVPAFLCRQTDLLVACARSGRAVNVKKGQFVAPKDMAHAVGKLTASGAEGRIFLTERGASFGYHNLVVDFRSLPLMRELGVPACMDATHAVQLPSAAGGKSGGERRFVAALARAAVAVGVDAVFLELHPRPDEALCDGPNSLDFDGFDRLVGELVAIRRALGQA